MTREIDIRLRNQRLALLVSALAMMATPVMAAPAADRPRVAAVQISTEHRVDDTYGLGEVICIVVEFNEPASSLFSARVY